MSVWGHELTLQQKSEFEVDSTFLVTMTKHYLVHVNTCTVNVKAKLDNTSNKLENSDNKFGFKLLAL